MANTASKKALRHGGVTVALTVLVVLAIILLNASVTSLAMRYGWFVNMNPTLLYPVTDTCFDYLDAYVIPDATEDIRIIFCDEAKTWTTPPKKNSKPTSTSASTTTNRLVSD